MNQPACSFRVLPEGAGAGRGSGHHHFREAGLLVAAVGEQLRDLAPRLRPSLLDDLGLRAGLSQLAVDFAATSGITIRAASGMWRGPDFPKWIWRCSGWLKRP
jgi:hypothetical protein